MSANRLPFSEDDEPSHDSYYVVLPQEVWQSEMDSPQVGIDEDDSDADAGYLCEPPRREPMSSAKAGGIGGLSAALVAGAIPAVVVDFLPAALTSGLAAGLFGGLMGRSLAIELHQRLS